MQRASITFLATGEGVRSDQRRTAEEWLARGGVRVARTCPHCGAGDHGRPRIGDRHLSLAYTSGLVAVAVAAVPIGVDVEVVGPVPAPFADRRAWTVVEAILKLTGEGVRREPSTVSTDEAWTATLPAPEGYVATLAAHHALEVSCRTGTVAALDPPATAPAAP